jgi:hypothetical protein
MSGLSEEVCGEILSQELNEQKVKEECQVTIRKKSLVTENLQYNGDIDRAWNTIRKNIITSAQESLGYCESRRQ